MAQTEMFPPEIVEKYTTEEAWLARRKKCLGASEIATLFGCHPYLTPNKLYHMKRGTAVDERRMDKGLANFGRVMEPIIAQLVADKTNWTLDPLAIQEHHLMPSNPRLGCTVDRFIVESERGPGILEIKNVNAFSPGWTETRAPDYIEYQIQHQLMVEGEIRGVKWGCIGAMIGGNPDDIRILVREPDSKVHAKIKEREAVFWKMVDEGREPDLMADDFDHIVDMFKEALPLPEEEVRHEEYPFEGLVMEYEEAKAATKKAQEVENLAKAKLLRGAMIDTPEGMKKNLAVITENRTAEFKLIHMNESVSTRKAHTQLRINIKENAKELKG